MKGLLVAVSLLLGGFASAKPIVWYHFNEKANGGKCSSGEQTIVNAAAIDGAAELNGTAKGLVWNSNTMEDSGAYYISYTNALDETTTWIDPVTGEKGDTRGGYVHISCEGDSNPDGVGYSGVVVAPDNEKLHLNRFTVEFFMKKDDVKYPSEVLPLQLYNSSGNTFAWQIRFGSCSDPVTNLVSQHEVKFNASKPDGTQLFARPFKPRYDTNDGKWHHVAMTYDGKTCRFYCDYLLLGSEDATLEYAANPADAVLAVGNSPRSTWGRYHGWIDEVRISDEVLEPRQFLRSIPVVCDKDTLVYVPFDRIEKGRGDFGYYGMTNNLNEVFPVASASFPANTGAGALPVQIGTYDEASVATITDAVPSADLCNGLFATDSVPNAHALNVAANGPYVRINDVSGDYHVTATNTAVTYEFFFRRLPDDVDNIVLFNMHSDASKTFARVWHANGYFAAVVCTTNLTDDAAIVSYGSETSNFAPISRSGWHHFAFVSDVEKRVCQYFVDYVPVATFTNAVLRPQKGVAHYAAGVNIGAAWSGSSFRATSTSSA